VARDWEQVTGQSAPGAENEYSPRTRRLLRLGPRIQPVRARAARPAGAPAEEEAQAARGFAEWHDMTPGEQVAAWASLRAWVTWLHDRYELSVEDRLPRCWPSHPGLVEELSALKAWREEIYSGGQPSGQAARYWHAELRQVLHAATAQYALGCRTGHRGASRLAADDPAVLTEWAAADPLACVPGIDLAAGTARRTGTVTATAEIGAALDNGTAIGVPGLRDTVFLDGRWLAPASSGWAEVPGPGRRGLPAAADAGGHPVPGGGEPDPWTTT
jgi:hypothetical protein